MSPFLPLALPVRSPSFPPILTEQETERRGGEADESAASNPIRLLPLRPNRRKHPEARAIVVVCNSAAPRHAQVSMPFPPSCRPFLLRSSRFTAPSAARPPGGSAAPIRLTQGPGVGGTGRGAAGCLSWRGSGVGGYVV